MKLKRKSILARKTKIAGRTYIPVEEIEEAYRAEFGLSSSSLFEQIMAVLFNLRKDPFFFADASYLEADEELIQMILDADMGDREEYEAEDYDCDDFAFNLMGVFHQNRETAAMPIFILWVNMPEGGHAIVSYYCRDGVKIIEPQNDDIYPVPDDWSLILLCG